MKNNSAQSRLIWKIVLGLVAVGILVAAVILIQGNRGGQKKPSAPAETTAAAKTTEEATPEEPSSSADIPESTTPEEAFDGHITITVQDKDQKVLASKEVGFMAGDTVADLLEANFEGVRLDNGMLMEIEGLTTPADWSSYIAFYINGEYAMQGIMTQPFADGDRIDFIDTVYLAPSEEAFDGHVTITVQDKDQKVLASKEVGFMAGDTVADLLEANFEGVRLDNGMLMEIEGLTTPADWSSYIAFYINGEYAMEGVMTQPFADGDKIDFIDTVYTPMP